SAATSVVAAGHGTLRNHLLGIQVLYADGRVAKAGGRVVKNVAGYDLMKLHHGALGTLGVIVGATLRLRPLPAADLLAWTEVKESAELVALATALDDARFGPAAVHFVGTIRGSDAGRALDGRVLVRFQGARSAVMEQAIALERALASRSGALEREALD